MKIEDKIEKLIYEQSMEPAFSKRPLKAKEKIYKKLYKEFMSGCRERFYFIIVYEDGRCVVKTGVVLKLINYPNPEVAGIQGVVAKIVVFDTFENGVDITTASISPSLIYGDEVTAEMQATTLTKNNKYKKTEENFIN